MKFTLTIRIATGGYNSWFEVRGPVQHTAACSEQDMARTLNTIEREFNQVHPEMRMHVLLEEQED